MDINYSYVPLKAQKKASKFLNCLFFCRQSLHLSVILLFFLNILLKWRKKIFKGNSFCIFHMISWSVYIVISLLIKWVLVHIDYEVRQMYSTAISTFLQDEKVEMLKHSFIHLNIHKWDLLQTNGNGCDFKWFFF